MSEVEVDGQPDKWGAPVLQTPSGTLTWYADLSELNIEGAGNVSDFQTEIDEAFGLWQDVAAVTFVQSFTPGADITLSVARLEEIAPTLANIEDAAGLASRWLSPGTEVDRITSVEIWFDDDLNWSLDDDFFKVAAHEIGHGIGLNHIHDPTQIMNPTVGVDELGNQDIAAAQALYGTGSGDDSDVPPPPPSDDDPVVVASDGGGGGGGIAVLVGLIAAVLAFIFGGGGGGAAAVAAIGRLDDEDDSDVPLVDPEDGLPELVMDQHALFLGEDGMFHEAGCGCSCCMGLDELEDELVV